jgi:hypothetical protein
MNSKSIGETMPTKFTSLCLIVVIISGLSCRAADTSEGRLLPLLTAPHGLHRLSPENQALLNEVKSHPLDFIPALKTEVEMRTDLREYLKEHRSSRFVGAYLVLFSIGTPEALAVVKDSHSEIMIHLSSRWKETRSYERGEAKSIDSVTGFLLQTERLIVNGFRGVRNPLLVGSAIELLTIADYATAFNALQYVAEVAATDTMAVASAARAVESSESSLNKDPVSREIVKALLKKQQDGN